MNTVADEKSGIDNLPMWATSRLVEIEKAHPGAEFAVMPLPTGPTGERGRKWTSPVFHVWVFRHDLEDIKVEALINQLNHERELHVNGPDKWNAYGAVDDMGSDGMWIEGHDWEWDTNCEIKLLEWQTGNEFRDIGFRHATYDGYQRHADLNRQRWRKADPATLNQAQKFWTQDPGMARQEAAYATLFDEAQFEIEDKWLGNPTPRMGELLPDLNALENEYYISIVLGKKPLDAFDEFVEKWHDIGGDEVAADVNEWYASTM
jgi:putative aldouronate transport system substrate-binding protein